MRRSTPYFFARGSHAQRQACFHAAQRTPTKAYFFRDCVKHFAGRYPTLSFSLCDQLLCMMFAQLTARTKLAHQGICRHQRQRGRTQVWCAVFHYVVVVIELAPSVDKVVVNQLSGHAYLRGNTRAK